MPVRFRRSIVRLALLSMAGGLIAALYLYASAAIRSAPTGMVRSDPDAPDVLNDGSRASIALMFSPKPGYGPEMVALLVISPQTRGRVTSRVEVGVGSGGVLQVGHLVGESKTDVFVFIDGQKTYARVLRFRGEHYDTLYKLEGGRPEVSLRWRDNGSECTADVVERWPVKQLGLGSRPPFTSCAFALRVFRWDGHKYRFLRTEPDRSGPT